MTLPEKLGRYEIISELGKGAMGIVYLGRDPLIGRQLALKTFRLGYSAGDEELEQFRVRFLREAQSAGILSHPNIVTIHDVAVDPEGDFFIAMEYVQGTDLKIVMQRQGLFEPSFSVEVVAQIAEGLGYAHSKGVVHRDIKPANIIITADKQAKITDFGIARVEASNLTMEGQLLGTPNYMAPEQIQGKEVDHRADIFSLGVMFYELLTGKKPFAAPNLSAVTHRIVFEPFAPLEQIVPGLPAGMTQVLDRALAKDPAQRYGRGDEMAADLRAIYAPVASPTATGATQATSRSGSFLDGPPAPGTGQIPIAAAQQVASTTSGAIPAVGGAGVPVADSTVVAGTVVTGARVPTPTGAIPTAGVSAPVPQATAAAAATPTGAIPAAVGPQESSGGTPIAGRIAMVLGLVVALAAAGFGIFKLIGSDDAPRVEELERRVLPLMEEGRRLLGGGQPAAALEVFERALAIAPENGEVRRWRDQAESQVGSVTGEPDLASRLEAAREALRARDYPTAIRLAEEALDVDPEQAEGKELLTEALAGEQRRQEIRSRLRNPPQSSPPTRPTSRRPTTPPPAASPPGVAAPPPVVPVALATLVVEFHSEASEGRLTIFAGQEMLHQKSFKFVTGKASVFSRQRAVPGSLRESLSLPSGDLDLRIYVKLKDAQTRTAEVAGNLPPGGTGVLKIEVSEQGRVSAALE